MEESQESQENLTRRVIDPEGSLTRREKRKLIKEETREEVGRSNPLKKFGKWIVVLLILAVLGWFGFSSFKNSKSPLPGESVPDAGRDHVTDIFGVKYTSNPPTSGSHFAVWAKPGVYNRFISDGYFIHSMEHGYVVIWYDCDKPISNFQLPISKVYAHDEPAAESTDSGELLKHMKIVPTANMSWFTPQNPPEEEIPLPDSFKSDSCRGLASKLSEFTKVAQRVIVVPRQNLDRAIAITAWGRIEKFDSVDKQKITAFIKAFHNRGPEQTQE